MTSHQEIADKHIFHFKQFFIRQDNSTMKVNTDGVLLGAWSAKNAKADRILEIGTGTGFMALMLAQKLVSSTIDAIDIDLSAYRQALYNFTNNELGKNITCHHCSLQNFSKLSHVHYDLIISNPPFFTGGVFSDNENKANVRHTIKLSHSELLSSVRTLLHRNGIFDVILPTTEGLRLIDMALNYGLYLTTKTQIITKENKTPERLLLRFSKTENTEVNTETILIRHADGKQYSKEYIDLTKDYYMFL